MLFTFTFSEIQNYVVAELNHKKSKSFLTYYQIGSSCHGNQVGMSSPVEKDFRRWDIPCCTTLPVSDHDDTASSLDSYTFPATGVALSFLVFRFHI